MKRAGFTLVELLISIVLMVILLSAVTLIFLRTTETVAIAESRQQVYTNARYAMDLMENDLMGCLSFSSGQNRFIMENGKTGNPGQFPAYGVSGNHISTAADRIVFRTTTSVGDTLQTCEVAYMLIPGDRALVGGGGTVDSASGIAGGNPDHQQTVRTNRPLYTLVRRVRVPDPNAAPGAAGGGWNQMPQDSQGDIIIDQELSHFVISFNLEYLASTQMANHPKNLTFSQLEPSYFTPGGAYDALGNGIGLNDDPNGQIVDPNGGPPIPTPIRVPSIRVTIVIVDDVGERQERIFQKVMTIPMG